MGIAAGHRKHKFHSLSANQLPPAVATLNHHSKCGCCMLLTRFPYRTFFSSISFLFLNSSDTSASWSNHHPPPKARFWCLYEGRFACSVAIQPAESKPAGRSKTSPVK